MEKTMKLIRGTTNTFNIVLQEADGKPYVLGENEVLRFGVKENTDFQRYQLRKDLTAADVNDTGDGYLLVLCPEDTQRLECGQYYYDMGLQADGDYFNVIACNAFIIEPNVTQKEA